MKRLTQRTGRRSQAFPSTWYHLTDRARFALDAQFTPADASLSVEDRSGRPGIYIAPDVEPWINGYGYWRPFVAEFHVDPSVVAAPGVHGRWGDELFVPATAFDKLVLQRVIPLDAYAREVFREHGWIESRLGREFDTGRAIPQKGWDEPWTIPFPDYHYPGPDVRDMPLAEARRLKRDLRVALRTAGKRGQAAQRWGDQQEIRRDDLEVVYSLVTLETAFANALDTFGYTSWRGGGSWTVGGSTFNLAQAAAAQGITAADLQAHGLFLHSIEVAAARRRRGWARRFVAAAERWAVKQGATWGVLAAVNSVPFWELGWTALPETFYSAPEGQSAVMVKRLVPPQPRGRGAARGVEAAHAFARQVVAELHAASQAGGGDPFWWDEGLGLGFRRYEVVGCGFSRTVLGVPGGKLVVKLPRDYESREANLVEATRWAQANSATRRFLAPVVGDGQDYLIQVRAQPAFWERLKTPTWRRALEALERDPEFQGIYDITRIDNWGLLRGRPVLLDYGYF